MSRGRAWRRHKNFTKALRKQEIDKALSPAWSDGRDMGVRRQFLFYYNLHEYSKGKIHCSCPGCSAKTRNKGKRRAMHANYAPSINYKISDRRKQDAMAANEQDVLVRGGPLLYGQGLDLCTE